MRQFRDVPIELAYGDGCADPCHGVFYAEGFDVAPDRFPQIGDCLLLGFAFAAFASPASFSEWLPHCTRALI